VAVCLLPGTEIAFEREVRYKNFLFPRKTGQKTAVFRKINERMSAAYHDSLEFGDGTILLLTRLCLGQEATVLELPAPSHGSQATEEQRQNRVTV